MCPDLLTSRLKRRRADSIGSPSPTSILMETPSSVLDAVVDMTYVGVY